MTFVLEKNNIYEQATDKKKKKRSSKERSRHKGDTIGQTSDGSSNNATSHKIRRHLQRESENLKSKTLTESD